MKIYDKFSNFKGLQCDMCHKVVECLTPLDLKKCYWYRGGNFQKPTLNTSVKNYELEICYSCLNWLSSRSITAIPLTKDLALAVLVRPSEPKLNNRLKKKLKGQARID